MNRRRVVWFLILATIGCLVAWAQTGDMEALLEAVLSLLGEKQAGQTFLNLSGPEGKFLETEAPIILSEFEPAEGPSPELLAVVEEALMDKAVPALPHGFLLDMPKEPGPVGNSFHEPPAD